MLKYNITKTLDIFLYENEVNLNVPTPKKSFLYHGSNIKNVNDIKLHGLLPDFGAVVKSTEAYRYYMDDDYYNPDDRVEGVIFFSDKPDTWSYSNYGNAPNINEALLVIVKKNATIYRKEGENVYDINNKRVDTIKYNNYNYLEVNKMPPFIESGDFFTFDEQEIYDILYGKRLIKYLSYFS